jgi:hypothetical protein
MARIYISSTFQDLVEERELAAAAVRSQRHEVLAMEDYVAEGTRPVKRCLQDVADCQIYIGIIGWRYGFVPSDDNPEKRSVTEMEYREARRLGRETLVFLQKLESARPQFMDAVAGVNDNGERIKRFRAELMAGADAGMVKEFGSPEELRSHVLAALPGAVSRVPSSGAPEQLKQLHKIGVQILKLWLFKSLYEDILTVYMCTPTLRSEGAGVVTAAEVRDAVRTSRRQLIPTLAALDEWDRYLTDAERRVTREFIAELGRTVQRLDELGSAQPEPGAPIGEGGVEAVDDFNKSLITLLNYLDGDADALWQAVRLGQLREVLDSIAPTAAGSQIGSVKEGCRELNVPPPLHMRCELLIREHNLLDDALETFNMLRKDVGQLDWGALSMYCGAINSQVDEARRQWQQFQAVERARKEAWEDDLLRLGQFHWKYIDQCQANACEALRGAEADPGELRPELRDKLRALRKALECHFQAVDKALASAYSRVKSTVGDPLLSALPAEELHAG